MKRYLISFVLCLLCATAAQAGRIVYPPINTYDTVVVTYNANSSRSSWVIFTNPDGKRVLIVSQGTKIQAPRVKPTIPKLPPIKYAYPPKQPTVVPPVYNPTVVTNPYFKEN